MNETLYRLIYISKNEIEGDEQSVRAEINQILTVARESNAALGVTGALMFNTGCFAQILEGYHDKVQKIFERIQCDLRHSNVIILDFSQTDTRGFDNWSMAYMGDSESSNTDFDRIAQETRFDPDQLSGNRIYNVLHEHLKEADMLSQTNKAA